MATTGSRCFLTKRHTESSQPLSARRRSCCVTRHGLRPRRSFLFFLYFTSCVAVLAVCLLFTLKCSYAADSLLCRDNHSGEEADHQIVRSSIGDRRNGRQERKKREDKHLVQTKDWSPSCSPPAPSPRCWTRSLRVVDALQACVWGDLLSVPLLLYVPTCCQ